MITFAATAAGADPGSGRRLSEILSALSYALDLTEGQPEGHAVRTCLIGMRIVQGAGVPLAERGPLFYALLLKDLGCSSNAARLCRVFGADDQRLKRDHALTEWTLGIAASHHERLDGRGYHRGLNGTALCPLSRALAVADVAEAITADRPYRAGLPWEQALAFLRKEAGAGSARRASPGWRRAESRAGARGADPGTRRVGGPDRVTPSIAEGACVGSWLLRFAQDDSRPRMTRGSG